MNNEIDCKHWASAIEAEFDADQEALEQMSYSADMDAGFDGGEWSGKFWGDQMSPVQDRVYENASLLWELKGWEPPFGRQISSWEFELAMRS